MVEKVKFTTTLDKKLLIDVKKKAIEQSQDVNEILESLLKDWLKKR